MTGDGHSMGTATPETRAAQGRTRRAQDSASVVLGGWPRLLTIEQAARYLNLCPEILREYIRSGRLRPVRPPRPDTARAHGYRQGHSRRTVASDRVRRTLLARETLDELVDQWKRGET